MYYNFSNLTTCSSVTWQLLRINNFQILRSFKSEKTKNKPVFALHYSLVVEGGAFKGGDKGKGKGITWRGILTWGGTGFKERG